MTGLGGLTGSGDILTRKLSLNERSSFEPVHSPTRFPFTSIYSLYQRRLHSIMFKSILPSSKRAPSFDLVVPDDKGGKENRPQHPLAKELTTKDNFRSSTPNSPITKKFEPVPAPMKLKERETGGLVGAGAMNRAFEKMLVRPFRLITSSRHRMTHDTTMHRMTCRYHPLSDRSLLRSTRPSRPPC